MTRINEPFVGQTEMSVWTRKNLEQIESHVAWRGGVDEAEAEALLEGCEVLTYLLRKGEEEKAYFITFVKEDGNIKHQRFTLEYDRKGWFYRNGTAESPRLITAEAIEELVPQMMCCSSVRCNALA